MNYRFEPTVRRMFENREDAGHKLAQRLREMGTSAELVLAIPRGGVVVGKAIAEELGIPLDIMEAQKLGAPGNPELGIGAVTAGGEVWLNEELIRALAVDPEYVEAAAKTQAENARAKARRLRADRSRAQIEGVHVIVVDDGIATGGTVQACIRETRARGAASITLAVPVAPPETLARLRAEIDEVVCLEAPEILGAVGQFYRDFRQVSEEEVLQIMADK